MKRTESNPFFSSFFEGSILRGYFNYRSDLFYFFGYFHQPKTGLPFLYKIVSRQLVVKKPASNKLFFSSSFILNG